MEQAGFLTPGAPLPTEQVVEHARVDDPAVDVLRPRERATLEEARRDARARELQGRDRPGRSRADDDDLEVGRHVASASRRRMARSVDAASATTARSAMAIIGQAASVLTATMRAGVPRPAVCWTAPEMPNAT